MNCHDVKSNSKTSLVYNYSERRVVITFEKDNNLKTMQRDPASGREATSRIQVYADLQYNRPIV